MFGTGGNRHRLGAGHARNDKAAAPSHSKVFATLKPYCVKVMNCAVRGAAAVASAASQTNKSPRAPPTKQTLTQKAAATTAQQDEEHIEALSCIRDIVICKHTTDLDVVQCVDYLLYPVTLTLQQHASVTTTRGADGNSSNDDSNAVGAAVARRVGRVFRERVFLRALLVVHAAIVRCWQARSTMKKLPLFLAQQRDFFGLFNLLLRFAAYEDASEEIRGQAISTIAVLFRIIRSLMDESPLFSTLLPSPTFQIPLGFCISCLLGVASATKSAYGGGGGGSYKLDASTNLKKTLGKRIRATSLEALRCIILVLSSKTLMAFLPGIISTLFRIITGDAKQGTAVICAALRAWTSALVAAQRPAAELDAETRTRLRQLLVSLYGSYTQGTVAATIPVRVRIELLHASFALLMLGSEDLLKTLVAPLEYILALTEDIHPQVYSVARAMVGVLPSLPSRACVIKRATRAIHSLPRVMHSGSDEQKCRTLHLVTSYLRLLGEHAAELLTSSSARLEASLLVACRVDISDTAVLEREDQEQPFYETRFVHANTEASSNALRNLCMALGQCCAGDGVCLLNVLKPFIETLRDSARAHFWKEALVVLNFAIVGASGRRGGSMDGNNSGSLTAAEGEQQTDDSFIREDCECCETFVSLKKKHLLSDARASDCSNHDRDSAMQSRYEALSPVVRVLFDTYVDSGLLSLRTSNIEAVVATARSDCPVVTLPTRMLTNHAVTVSLLIKGLGEMALTQDDGVFEREYSLRVLYPLLEKLGDANPLVSQSAAAALARIGRASRCSVERLILRNVDYIVDAVAARLRLMTSLLGSSQHEGLEFDGPGHQDNQVIVLRGNVYSQAVLFDHSSTLPRVLIALLGRVGPEAASRIVPLLDDILDNVLDGLDWTMNAEGEVNVDIYLAILHSTVRAMLSGAQTMDANLIESEQGKKGTYALESYDMNADLAAVMTRFHEVKKWQDIQLEALKGNRRLPGGAEQIADAAASSSSPAATMEPGSGEPPPPTRMQGLVQRILARCSPLLASRSPHQQCLVLEIVQVCIRILAVRERLLLPAVAKLWPAFRARLILYRPKTSTAANVLSSVLVSDENTTSHKPVFVQALSVLETMSETCGSFLAQRFSSDVWPVLVDVLAHETRNAAVLRGLSDQHYVYSSAYRVQRSVLTCLTNVLRLETMQDSKRHKRSMVGSLLGPIAMAVRPFLDESLPEKLQSCGTSLFQALIARNPDIVWSVLTEQRKEMMLRGRGSCSARVDARLSRRNRALGVIFGSSSTSRSNLCEDYDMRQKSGQFQHDLKPLSANASLLLRQVLCASERMVPFWTTARIAVD